MKTTAMIVVSANICHFDRSEKSKISPSGRNDNPELKGKHNVGGRIEALKDPVEAAEYLNAALADGDQEVFLLALRDVAEARGGTTKLAQEAKLNRESLYRMLSEKGNPELHSLGTLLDALGFRLAIEVKKVS